MTGVDHLSTRNMAIRRYMQHTIADLKVDTYNGRLRRSLPKILATPTDALPLAACFRSTHPALHQDSPSSVIALGHKLARTAVVTRLGSAEHSAAL